MVQTARKTHSRTPNCWCGTGPCYRKNAGNAVFTGFLRIFCYTNSCIKNVVLIDWTKHLDGILTSAGENFLTGNGTVSHLQAMDEAQTEYKKYKARTISSVEKDYLDSIKLLEEKGKNK